eukprot:scaffold253_cov243-Pinguiococcus_pyrenoidosus.AAC.14
MSLEAFSSPASPEDDERAPPGSEYRLFRPLRFPCLRKAGDPLKNARQGWSLRPSTGLGAGGLPSRAVSDRESRISISARTGALMPARRAREYLLRARKRRATR